MNRASRSAKIEKRPITWRLLARVFKKRSFRQGVAVFLIGVLMLGLSIAALATVSPGTTEEAAETASATPAASATAAPTTSAQTQAAQTVAPSTQQASGTPYINTEGPEITFDATFTMTPEDEFFDDGRTNIADYENPAYTADRDDDPDYLDNVVDEFIAELFDDNADTMNLVIMLTMLGLLPSLLVMVTGFTRIVIVLSFVRNAMGTNNMPPNTVIIGLALFLTFFVMFPVFETIGDVALEPYLAGDIDMPEAITLAMDPLREFMMANTYITDLELFWSYSGEDIMGLDITEAPTHVLIPAFLVSEIKNAFILGFFIYLPFIVIDMVVASTLMSMGMMMLPPVMISLPFKVLLFVSVDGWQLVIQTLITSFHYYS